MEDKHSKIIELLEKNSDDLYAEIGERLTKSMLPKSIEYLINLGKEWFASKLPQFKEAICQNEDIKILMSEDTTIQNKLNLIMAISDFIASLKIGVSPITVSVLIFKEGVSKICSQL